MSKTKTIEEMDQKMFTAIIKNDNSMLNLAFQNGASINARDSYLSRLPIHVVAQHGHRETVRTVINNSGYLYFPQRDHSGWTPLHIATYYLNLEAIEEFLKADAYVNSTTSTERWTPLLLAFMKKNHHDSRFLEVIEKLIEFGANVNVTQNYSSQRFYRSTLLHIAVMGNNFEATKKLVMAGAEVNATDMQGLTPLFFALTNQNEDIARFLIQSGASLLSKDVFTGHRIFTAAIKNKMFNVVVSTKLGGRKCF